MRKLESEQRRARALKLHDDGLTVRQITLRLEMDPTSVSRLLIASGREPRLHSKAYAGPLVSGDGTRHLRPHFIERDTQVSCES
jgi:Homeodomain-like domain-containing protein